MCVNSLDGKMGGGKDIYSSHSYPWKPGRFCLQHWSRAVAGLRNLYNHPVNLSCFPSTHGTDRLRRIINTDLLSKHLGVSLSRRGDVTGILRTLKFHHKDQGRDRVPAVLTTFAHYPVDLALRIREERSHVKILDMSGQN